MRKLIYVLSDGTRVKTLEEAKKSGLSYEINFEKVAEGGNVLSAKRQELMAKFGFVPVKSRKF